MAGSFEEMSTSAATLNSAEPLPTEPGRSIPQLPLLVFDSRVLRKVPFLCVVETVDILFSRFETQMTHDVYCLRQLVPHFSNARRNAIAEHFGPFLLNTASLRRLAVF